MKGDFSRSTFRATNHYSQVRAQQGRGVLGVIDGMSPRGVESEKDADERKALLRRFGYKA